MGSYSHKAHVAHPRILDILLAESVLHPQLLIPFPLLCQSPLFFSPLFFLFLSCFFLLHSLLLLLCVKYIFTGSFLIKLCELFFGHFSHSFSTAGIYEFWMLLSTQEWDTINSLPGELRCITKALRFKEERNKFVVRNSSEQCVEDKTWTTH